MLKLKIPEIEQNLLDLCYPKEWVVYCKPPFKVTPCVVEYLGRYTHRVAISNNRILKIENHPITFKWQDYRDNSRWKEIVLNVDEFIRRFLMHILPQGFMKIRRYGFLPGRSKQKNLEYEKFKPELVLPLKKNFLPNSLFKKFSEENHLSVYTADTPVCSEPDFPLNYINNQPS